MPRAGRAQYDSNFCHAAHYEYLFHHIPQTCENKNEQHEPVTTKTKTTTAHCNICRSQSYTTTERNMS